MDSVCPHNNTFHCGDCRMNALCLPLALQTKEVERLNEIIQRSKPLQKNHHIYHAGEKFYSVFAVRSGSIKSYTISNSGQEQVTGFHLPGEIFGLDGIGRNRYSSSAVAMETSSVCEIPFNRLQELSTAIPALQQRFFQLMSLEITGDQQLISLLSKNTAEERVATLLVSIANRNLRLKLSATRFRLPMSRADIGNYLGLTVETVSRVLSRFQKQALLKVDKKEIELLNLDKLRELAN